MMMKITIYNKNNKKILQVEGDEEVTLSYQKEYEVGDKIVITTDKSDYVWVQIDEFIKAATVYAPNKTIEFEIPTDKARWAYHFCAFEANQHVITAKEVSQDAFKSRVNIAENSIDQRYSIGCYPHASTNYVSQEQGWFEAKNAINGNTDTRGHGPYPWQSWASDKRDDIEFQIDFGRKVIVDEIVLYLRADDFLDHDTYWSEGVLEFSDGTMEKITMKESAGAQSYPFRQKCITWVKLHSLKRVNENMFAALTEMEVYGYEDFIKDEGMKVEQFQKQIHLDSTLLKEGLQDAMNKIKQNSTKFGYQFPESATVNGVYSLCKNANVRGITYEPGSNIGWTTSFWTGLLLLAFEHNNSEEIMDFVKNHRDSFHQRITEKVDCNTHDLGFLYSLSCVALYKLNGDKKAKEAALMAAEFLMSRYVETAGIIQAWGNMNDPAEQGRMIVDCLMNLPLLYWASEVTGDSKFKDAAYSHAKKAAQYMVRADGTTYHTYFFDVHTGEAKYGNTAQGYADDSCWARGQAWAIYGFALSYAYIGDEIFLDVARKTANYFLNRSPEDLIVYWDLIFNKESQQEKDSSASVIALCGLLELQKHLKSEQEKQYYQNAAKCMMKALIEHYATKADDTANEGVLQHGVYIKTSIQYGVDEANLWGDYFYVEALTRLTLDWNMYW
ncbi:MAG: glycoside hydrolase family 88 protein [Suipraeoptans sp.]